MAQEQFLVNKSDLETLMEYLSKKPYFESARLISSFASLEQVGNPIGGGGSNPVPKKKKTS